MMFRKSLKCSVVLFSLVGLTATTVRAEPTAVDDKAAAIQELLTEMNVKQNAETMLQSMLVQVGQQMNQLIPQMIKTDPSLTPDQRKAAMQQATARESEAFQRYNQLFKQQVDFGKTVMDVSTQVYDKYYTRDEIQDLITFYKTPTGKKMIEVMPKLASESMQLSNARLMPKTSSILRQVLGEEMAAMKKGK